ncbi:MAG: GDP-mannose dehydrogenase [Acidobacteria bacterium]|nr:MAG: GDP-mannose dehydrogenase [Acidobacteriota bacterium]
MIGFAGLSHLGVVSAIATAAKGFEVLAYDGDASLCESLNRGQISFFEPELEKLLKVNQSRIRFVADAAALTQCDVIYFSRDVATDDQGRSNLSPLTDLIERVVPSAAMGATLVILSQVPPGFTRRLAKKVGQSFADRQLQVCYQVETLIFGRAVERALYPERFIIGAADGRRALPRAFTELLAAFTCPILTMRYESAELAKISINMCLVSSVSVANTMAELCERIGADWSEIVPALKLDKRIGPHAYLSPGLGIAGGNLERDLATVVALANEFGADDGVVDSWISNSRYRRDWVLQQMHQQVLSRIQNPLIAIWGLAYKQDTDSTRNSPALFLIEALKPFRIQAYDPSVKLDRVSAANLRQTESALDACAGADVLAIMTPWKEFSDISLDDIKVSMKGRSIIDPYGTLNGDACIEAEFSYFKLGSGDCE